MGMGMGMGMGISNHQNTRVITVEHVLRLHVLNVNQYITEVIIRVIDLCAHHVEHVITKQQREIKDGDKKRMRKYFII
jgi:hypothetical protein